MTVDRYLLDYLDEKKITKAEFAKSIDISIHTLNKFLKGGNIGMHEFGRIVKAMGGDVRVRFC